MRRKMIRHFKNNQKLIISAAIIGGIINAICSIRDQMSIGGIIVRTVLSVVLIMAITWIGLAAIDSVMTVDNSKE
ncbi:MAG: hypothetical protein HFJ54_03225 [Clostridia bacterium]|nr:hypothetical protein [Clostridia bacterium]